MTPPSLQGATDGHAKPNVRATRRRRIVWLVVAMFGMVALTPTAFLSWRLIRTNYELLTTEEQSRQLLLAQAVSRGMEVRLDGLESQLLRVAQTLGAAIQGDGSVPAGQVRSVLTEVAEEPLLYLSYSHSGAKGGRSITAGELSEPFAPPFRAAHRQAVQTLAMTHGSKVALISDPILSKEENPRALMLVSAPVRSKGRLRGVLSGLVDLQAVWSSVAWRRAELIYAVNASGRVFASTDPRRIPPGEDVKDSPIVERFLSGGNLNFETMPYVENNSDQKYIGSYATPLADDWGWAVFVRASELEVYGQIQRMIESAIGSALGALGLATLTALFFARSLSTPINRLAAVSRAFSRGDFRTRVATRSRNEIGDLAFAFNKMADEMEEHISNLKQAAEENSSLFHGTIRALAEAIDAKDPYTRGHSGRVNRYSVIIARELGLDDDEIHDIDVASLLHDVGKIAIAEHVLNKPGKLTDEEFELMKTHTTRGADIMAPIPHMQNILPGIRWHHERIRGGGYPDGLMGDQIPLMARIIAVADTFDAVTTTRPYQRKMTPQEALEVINKLKGVSLDDQVVAAFFRAYRAGKIRLDGQALAG